MVFLAVFAVAVESVQAMVANVNEIAAIIDDGDGFKARISTLVAKISPSSKRILHGMPTAVRVSGARRARRSNAFCDARGGWGVINPPAQLKRLAEDKAVTDDSRSLKLSRFCEPLSLAFRRNL